MSGWRNQNALAHCGRKLEQSLARDITIGLVKQHIFALSRHDFYLVVAHHIVDFVGKNARAVDNEVGRVTASVLTFHNPLVRLFYGRNLFVKFKTYAVGICIFRISNGHFVRTNDARGRCNERGNYLVANVRLYLSHLVAHQYFQAFDAVFDTLLIQLGESREVLLVKAQDHSAYSLERKIEFF